MNRRGFLKGILAAGISPFVITSSGVLMPVRARSVWTFGGSILEVVGDGVTDDTEALQAWLDGKAVLYQGNLLGNFLFNGTFRISDSLLSGPVDAPLLTTEMEKCHSSTY